MEENKTRQELREEQLQSQAPRRRKKRKSVGELILQDLLLIAFILLSFALVHHVIPRMMKGSYEAPEARDIRPTAAVTAVPETTAAWFESAEARPVLERIRQASAVVHY